MNLFKNLIRSASRKRSLLAISEIQLSESVKPTDNFLPQSFLGLALVNLAFLTPFSINNFVQGRYMLGFGALLIISIFSFNAWAIVAKHRYYSALTLFGLVPAILIFLSMSIRAQGIIGILWSYPAASAFYFILPEKKAWVANAVLLAVILPVAWQAVESAVAVRMVATLLTISIFSAIFIRAINQQQQALRMQVTTDPLTGLLNRTLLNETLEQACAQNQRTQIPMTLAAFDIDHFKQINDTFGHDLGDQVLRTMGELFCARVRRTDKAFRLGGEEFLVLLYGTAAKEGWVVAEELRISIASHPLLPDRPVTVSVGLATLEPTETWQTWMKRSDKNLYRAKHAGRNRIAA